MLYLRHSKFLSPVLVLILSLLCVSRALAASVDDNGVRVDLPPGGEVSISNARGSVRIEVWGEQHVSVVASVKGLKPKRSPITINRTEQLLTISVNPREVGIETRVDLTLRLPERSRAAVASETGDVIIRGLPAELRVESVYGNIVAEFPASGDADIEAESPAKGVVSTLLLKGSEVAGKTAFQARLGAGGKRVHLVSRRGRVSLASYGEPFNAPPAAATTTMSTTTAAGQERKVPVLIGAEQNKTGAGTPATPLTGPEEIDEGDILRVDTELVTLNLSVIDRGTNRGLRGLLSNDFKLYEDGREQQVTQFESANVPFNLVLLIDVSFSTQEKIGLIRDAALRFVNAARPSDRIGVITFAKNPIVVSPLTDDREALRRRINEGIQPRGSTKVYDSIAFAMDEVLKDSKNSRRNAIILMSDGLDSTMPNVTGEGSVLDYNEIVRRVREFDGVLYTLWIDTETEYSSLSPLDVQPETFDLAHDQLEQLAEAGGGIFYEVEKLEDLADAYERVVADLGTVYSLSYRPTNKGRDGKWRAIRVSVARPNAVARGKRGYYAN
ncbi:MAG TPA: VWA domain-containing protein [Pyrinomonadaceae bacterium]|nr:VWA domain-containing protein [Pyrinomonadaceae bacterium]